MDYHYHNCWTHCSAEKWQYGAGAAIWTLIKIKALSSLAASAAAFFGSCYTVVK